MSRHAVYKGIIILLALLVLFGGGKQLYSHRHYQEVIVKGPGVTKIVKLSDYFDGIKGSINDADVYFFEGESDGGTMLVFGGSHANEPAAALAATLLVETAQVDVGRLIVIPYINKSASTGTQPSTGYPLFYSIETEWGERTFRMGDRITHPLDQWPDPDVYTHYPTGQLLSYMDIRNMNRAWPGRADGTLTEKTSFAVMEMIRKENVDIAVDIHEAELMYPVTNCIVAHPKGMTLAIMVSIDLSATEFDIHVEPSPSGYRGLSHREIGDHSQAISLLLESPIPFLDQPTGPKTVELLLAGKDEFLLRAKDYDLLFVGYDEDGKPIDMRVGRHTSTIMAICAEWSDWNPGREIVINAPGYKDILGNGIGYYLNDPDQADPADVLFQ